MKIFKIEALWSLIIVASLVTACSSEHSSTENKVSSQDIVNAVELTLPATQIPEVNAGYGNVLEISSETTPDNMYFSKEENSEWLYVKATETGLLSFVIKPEEPGKDYNFLVFKKTGSDFAKDVVEKHIQPLRSNMTKATSGGYDSTGLSCESISEFEGVDGVSAYSKALSVEKDSIYYIVVNHSHKSGKGYTVRLFYCGQGDNTTAQTDSIPAAVETPLPTLAHIPAPVAEEKPHNFKPATNLPELGPDEEYYVVQKGNTVYSISTAHGMKVIELMSRNRLNGNGIHVGQTLVVRKKGAPAPQASHEVAQTPSHQEKPTRPADPTPTPAPKEEHAPAVAPKAQSQPEEPAKKEEPAVAHQEPAAETPAATEPRATNKPVSSGSTATPTSIEGSNAVPESVQKLWVYINVVNAKNNSPVNTIVQVIDGANNKKVDRAPSNQLTYVPIYASSSRRKIFVLDAFSFRKESFELDLDNLRNDSSANQLALVNDTIVLNFELERYKKNDIFAAYNIFFYDDASVMLPKSKYELESLLEMLKENPKVAIRIHGHTNSSSMGKIISLEPGDKEFFRLTAKNKESFGTAVMLSKRRAESIKYYLEYNGIKAPRLEIKGWGGKKMIYERDVPLAHKNKRVEIEILED